MRLYTHWGSVVQVVSFFLLPPPNMYYLCITTWEGIDEAKFIKFGTLLVGCHLEGTMSQIFYLGPSFYFMKSRKFSSKK